MIVGVVGGIASGKSTVTRLLVEIGAAAGTMAIDADEIAHEVIELPEVKAAIRGWLGEVVFTADGRVDRVALGRRVFDDPGALARLEKLVHPEVRERIEERVREFQRDPKQQEKLLVLDVPLLATSSLRHLCDEIIYVDAPLDLRRDRAQERGWTAAELDHREAAQPSQELKRELATRHIDNSGTLDSTRRQVASVYDLLVGDATSEEPAAPASADRSPNTEWK